MTYLPNEQLVSLNGQYQLKASGFTANARRIPVVAGQRSGERALGTNAYQEALKNAQFQELDAIHLDAVKELPGGAVTRALDRLDLPSVELHVPAEPGKATVVMAVDDQGIVTWHFPQPQPVTDKRRRESEMLLFDIPMFSPGAVTEESQSRGIVGDIVGKVLKVLVYDRVKEGVKDYAAGWERKHRPSRLRSFTVADYRQPEGQILSGTELQETFKGRALLFVHGTFSRTDAAYGELGDELVRDLHQTYEGHVLSFDHPSVSVDPNANAMTFLELLEEIPAEQTVEIDIVAHSRGGLVARAIAQKLHESGRGSVRSIVFCGTPNLGTVLADPVHMVGMLNRITTLLNLAPPGAVAITAVLESVMVVVKIAGEAALEGLSGLASMKPGGPYLSELDRFSIEKCFVVTSNFAAQGGLKQLDMYVRDGVRDYFFNNQANDLVVPTNGVAAKLQVSDSLEFKPEEGVHHSGFFSRTATRDKFRAWLTAQ